VMWPYNKKLKALRLTTCALSCATSNVNCVMWLCYYTAATHHTQERAAAGYKRAADKLISKAHTQQSDKVDA
jgi:hypothetical protein